MDRTTASGRVHPGDKATRLRRTFGRMAELSWEDRLALARVRETRMQPSAPSERLAERERFARSLDHYTHVTRGFDVDGRVRYFNAIRWEPRRRSDGRQIAVVVLGPHFKERGVYVVAPQAGAVRFGTLAMLKRPWGTLVFGSAVSFRGYQTLLHYLRGVIPVYLYGDADAPAACRRVLASLTEGVEDGQVHWDSDRQLLAYPSGPAVTRTEVTGLSPEEADRYLSRAPGALGEDPGAVVPIAAQFRFADAVRWFAHRSGTQLTGLLRAWIPAKGSDIAP